MADIEVVYNISGSTFDTTAVQAFEQHFFSDNISLLSGRPAKSPGRNDMMMSFLPAAGEGIPRGSVITSAVVEGESNVALFTAYNWDISLLTPDGFWELDTPGAVWKPVCKHYDFQWELFDGVTSIAASADMSTAGDPLEHSINIGFVTTVQFSYQTFTATSTGTIDAIDVWLSAFGDWGGVNPGQFVYPEVYQALPDEDVPDFGVGVIGDAQGNVFFMGGLTPTLTKQTFDLTLGGGTPAPVTSGERYCVLLNRSWAGFGIGGTTPGELTYSIGYKGVLGGPKSYTGGAAGTILTRAGFNPSSYPIEADLPRVYKADGTTLLNEPGKEQPFGSIVREAAIGFGAPNTAWSTGDFKELVQQWVNQDNYDPQHPIGVAIGAGDAEADEWRAAKSWDLASGTGAPLLRITYRPRHLWIA